jgi:ectoine hydroxylase-related dioxygenase (phytanoyl-CoA dioxygenase family)
MAEPGDVTIFEQRLWHAAAPNISAPPRVSLFYCYGYRWLRPQDYGDLSAEQLAGMNPIRRQLLGAKASVMGYHLPTDDDIPLAAWYEEKVGARAAVEHAR